MSDSTPFVQFDRPSWREYRQDTPLTLTEQDLDRIRGFNDPVSLDEVREVYLPLSRLLNLYVEASLGLYDVTSQFLGHPEPRVPYIIGVSGSVAVGKSTTSRLLQALLSRWPSHPEVALITTDGFLMSTAELNARGLMGRKGFPESYHLRELLQCLQDIKSGKHNIQVPRYSHEVYDILPGEFNIIEQPDIVIVEGLNVLQVGPRKKGQASSVYVSDFFDFSIYVDADIAMIEKWYMERFMDFRLKALDDPNLFMHQFSKMSDSEATKIAQYYWHEVNAANYHANIEPYRQRARCILQKAPDHSVQNIYLRKI